MMLAIPNEKIMREVKESLTTAAVGKQRRLSNFEHKSHIQRANTALPSCVQKPLAKEWKEKILGWAEFQLSQFWRNKFHIFENNNTTPLHTFSPTVRFERSMLAENTENGNLKRPMRK